MKAGTAEAPRLRAALGFIAALGAGAVCVPLAVILGQLESRYMIAAMAALAALVGLSLLGSLARVRMVLVAALALGLSIGLSISFLHHTELPGRYAPFVGGALAVTASLAQLAAAGYLVCWLLESRLVGRPRPLRLVSLVLWPQLLFMAAGVLSLSNAIHPSLAWLEMLRLAGLLLISIVMMNLTTRELMVYLWVLALSVMLQAGLAGVQFATGRELGLGVLGEAKLLNYRIAAVQVARPTGTIGDANMLAYFFEITFPVMLAMFYLARHDLTRLAAAAATVAGAAGMVAAYSRAAWMTVPVSVAFVTLRILGRRVVSLRTAIVLILLTMALAVSMIWLWPLIERRIFGDDAGSVAHRWPLAQAALSIYAQFPVLGIGLNNFAVSFTAYDLTGYSRVFPGGDHVVHNLHLLILTETGMVGFAAHVLMFGGAAWLAFTTNGDRVAQGLAVATFAGLLAHLGHGMVDPGFKLSLTISQLVAAQLGLLGCLWLQARDLSRVGISAGVGAGAMAPVGAGHRG